MGNFAHRTIKCTNSPAGQKESAMTNLNINSTLNNNDTINKLAEIAKTLFETGIPSCVWEDFGEADEITGFVDEHPNYQWSATKEEAEVKLGRKMSPDEVTLLSLGRYFGPTPSLSDSLAQEVMAFVWPDGNLGGDGLDWMELATDLDKFVEMKEATIVTTEVVAKDMAFAMLNTKGYDPYWGPYHALNNHGRLLVRVGKVSEAVHFVRTLRDELQNQTLCLAQKMQSPAWGHLKSIFQKKVLFRDEAVTTLIYKGTLPVGKLSEAVSACLRADELYEDFIREGGIIEHLQD